MLKDVELQNLTSIDVAPKHRHGSPFLQFDRGTSDSAACHYDMLLYALRITSMQKTRDRSAWSRKSASFAQKSNKTLQNCDKNFQNGGLLV